jgi:Protein of unknown function (DUF1153)
VTAPAGGPIRRFSHDGGLSPRPSASPPIGLATADGFMELPPLGTIRWTACHKAAIVRAVRNGTLSPGEVHSRYMISDEELAAWQADFDRNGLAGLQQKSLRQRRRAHR